MRNEWNNVLNYIIWLERFGYDEQEDGEKVVIFYRLNN